MPWRERPNAYKRSHALAIQYGAVDLSAGDPEFDLPDSLLRDAHAAISAGHTRYSPPEGIGELREAVARYACQTPIPAPLEQVTVFAGATEAIFACLKAFVSPGQTVVGIEPAYDYYPVMCDLTGAVWVTVPMRRGEGEFTLDYEALERAVTPEVRAILINTPHNPTGVVYSREDLEFIRMLAAKHDAFLISDEVYDTFAYDTPFCSLALVNGIDDRTIVISSASKRFGVPGWRVGWAISNARNAQRLRLVRQHMSVCAPTPLQVAVAAGLTSTSETDFYERTANALRQRRDALFDVLSGTALMPIRPAAGYFMLAGWRHGAKPPADIGAWAARHLGIAALSLQTYSSEPGLTDNYIRIAFCKSAATLNEAVARIGASTCAGAPE